ncbi:MAG TPA: glycosyltransferase [Longimicrobiaceae bacterium]|nr:glycosyltransferase [Longimicrobiaceae bacterium]
MKIILTVHQFLPDFSTGTEVIALGIARELRDRGHEITVVTGFPDSRRLADAERFDRYRYDGIRVERFRHAFHPMGGQRVVTELAYDNRLFARVFGELLDEIEPDLVHFVHLARLSASIIGPCAERRIPTILTATDFWAVCPFSQLRLADNSICPGPDPSGINCVRHYATNLGVRRTSLAGLVKQAPDWLLGLGVRAAKQGLPLAPPFLAEVRGLVLRQPFLREQLNRIGRVLAPSRLMERTLVESGIAPERVRFLPYGIGTEGITPPPDRGSGPGLRLGFIGSLTEHKGLDVAVKAVRLLDPALPVELSIHGVPGQGPASQAFHRNIRTLAEGDPRIRLCGPFRNERVQHVLASLDALLVPSVWHENTPLVVYEAFAAGCPVIASDVEGISEVVHHERNGLLFNRGDAADLAACIRRVVEDRALLQRLASGTRPPLSVSDHVTRLEAIYREVRGERDVIRPAPHADPAAPGSGLRPDRPQPTVQILLSTYNGQAFLLPLLRSLDEQTYPHLDLLVRDDGSTDGTLTLLQEHTGRVPMELRPGLHLGLPDTYFQLLRESREDADLFAFCDQDDVWMPDKISRAVEALSRTDPTAPAMYCGRTRYVDRSLRPLGMSELPRHPLSFRNALVQNVASGCTIVMNRAARDLLAESTPEGVFMHDAWTYLVVAAFGTVLYDPVPAVLYRQHGANTIGRPQGWLGRLAQLARHGWTWPHFLQAVHFQRIYGSRLQGEDRRALDRLLESRTNLCARVRYALSADVHRSKLSDDLAFRLLFVLARM